MPNRRNSFQVEDSWNYRSLKLEDLFEVKESNFLVYIWGGKDSDSQHWKLK